MASAAMDAGFLAPKGCSRLYNFYKFIFVRMGFLSDEERVVNIKGVKSLIDYLFDNDSRAEYTAYSRGRAIFGRDNKKLSSQLEI